MEVYIPKAGSANYGLLGGAERGEKLKGASLDLLL